MCSRIKWNFTKFLVDKEGRVIKRYGTTTAPLSIEVLSLSLSLSLKATTIGGFTANGGKMNPVVEPQEVRFVVASKWNFDAEEKHTCEGGDGGSKAGSGGEVGVSGSGSGLRGESGGLNDNEKREKGREEKNLRLFETLMEER
ncbi:hypothetical protein FH972_006110 [Carpinus fangiana]|uniref:Glutathione peroxidase n=1 Tax=Carpinus fangiana TaxID=176857 RepID=A0A5N6QS90_9ROSI|nr:hypothetical protein FH972_006110 [Carpinus fangiana]